MRWPDRLLHMINHAPPPEIEIDPELDAEKERADKALKKTEGVLRQHRALVLAAQRYDDRLGRRGR